MSVCVCVCLCLSLKRGLYVFVCVSNRGTREVKRGVKVKRVEERGRKRERGSTDSRKKGRSVRFPFSIQRHSLVLI